MPREDLDVVSLTPIFEEVENGWVQARVRELPAVITVGKSRAEAEQLLRDALREYAVALEEEGEQLPVVAAADEVELATSQ